MARSKQLGPDTEPAKDYLDGKAQEFEHKGIACQTRLCYGPVVEEILSTAEQESADIIALVTHERIALSQVFHDSIATRILQRMHLPLLIVRSQE